MSIIPQKLCARCGITKPISEFSATPKSLDGHFHQCKVCIRYRCVSDDEYFAYIRRGLHRCSKCQEWKNPDCFVRNTQDCTGLSSHCIECHRIVANDYASRNRKKLTQANDIWRQANRARHLETRKVWRKQHAEGERERSREWQKRNLERVKANTHKRRARMLSNGGSFTQEEWLSLCAHYEYRCLCCGEHRPLTVDHIIPIAKGGMNTIDNIQPLCKPCNSAKRIKIIDYREV